MTIRIAVSCDLSQHNPHEFISCLANAESIDLFVITDGVNYPTVRGLDQSRIYHYLPSWSTRYVTVPFNPVDKRELNSILDEINPDILLTLGISKLLFLPLATNFTPTVFLPQGGETAKAIGEPTHTDKRWDLLYYRMFYRPVFKRLLAHVDEVWRPAPDMDLFVELGLDAEKFRSFDWSAAVDTEKFSPNTNGVSFGDPNDVVIGSLRRIRGHQMIPAYSTFLDAVGELNDDRDDFHVVIGGLYDDGKSSQVESVIDEKIKNYSLDEKVSKQKIVPKEEIHRYYAGIDVFLNFTHHNVSVSGLGTCAKEAMASGCVPIMFNDIDTTYVIEHDKNGLISPWDDSEKLYNMLSELCNSEKKRSYISNNARNSVIENYTADIISSRTLQYCSEILK